MNYDDDTRNDFHVEARDLRETAQKHGDACSEWLRFRREYDMRMEASYSNTATKGICKAPSCAVRSPVTAGRRTQVHLATVSVTVSMGAKPAQAEGKCSSVHRLDTVALLHTCFLSLQTCQTHLTILPTHSRWLKVCRKTENRVAFDSVVLCAMLCCVVLCCVLLLWSWWSWLWWWRREREERKVIDYSNHLVADSRQSFPGITGAQQPRQVKRMIGGIWNMLFSIFSQTENV